MKKSAKLREKINDSLNKNELGALKEGQTSKGPGIQHWLSNPYESDLDERRRFSM